MLAYKDFFRFSCEKLVVMKFWMTSVKNDHGYERATV